jgi:large subunit ribosomal protein L10
MPSAKILAQKQKELTELVNKIKNSTAGVLVNYQGITVEDDTVLRKALRKAGVDYTVYKNTMTSRACDETGYTGMKPYLKGMIALAISSDPIAPAKILREYAEKIESFEIKAGYVDGQVIDKQGVIALADIPSKEGLIAKLLGSLQAPLYGLAYVLQAKIDKENGSNAAEAPAAE